MRKFAKSLWRVSVILFMFCIGMLAADKHTLRTQIVRMHVISNSDNIKDQTAKFAVRDAVMEYLVENLKEVRDITMARQIITVSPSTLEEISNEALQKVGSNDLTTVVLTSEEFHKREYETFSLPAGVYESLRIEIGKGEGKNWWCVVFPSLCLPLTTDDFQTAAVSSGFDQGLVDALSNDRAYELRFFLLDCVGKIENFIIFYEKTINRAKCMIL